MNISKLASFLAAPFALLAFYTPAMAQTTPLEDIAASFDTSSYQSLIATVGPQIFAISFAIVAIYFVVRMVRGSGK